MITNAPPVIYATLHGKQQIQLMDAHSLPHAYLDSAIATFVKVGSTTSMKLCNISHE